MAYIVKAYTSEEINMNPESLVEEVLQNVKMILTTPQMSVPLDRGFGLAQRFVDKPMPIAQAIIVQEVLDAIERDEPRARVGEVTFADDMTGKLIPQVEVEIINGTD